MKIARDRRVIAESLIYGATTVISGLHKFSPGDFAFVFVA